MYNDNGSSPSSGYIQSEDFFVKEQKSRVNLKLTSKAAKLTSK